MIHVLSSQARSRQAGHSGQAARQAGRRHNRVSDPTLTATRHAVQTSTSGQDEDFEVNARTSHAPNARCYSLPFGAETGPRATPVCEAELGLKGITWSQLLW
jgi:hypothetical protein